MSQYPRGSEWRKWDLHMHSTASDGTATPQQIIEQAKAKGLSVIAITDHHTAKNIDETKRIGLEHGIHVISGIEFRTEYGEKSVHIIGLFPDKFDKILLDQNALHDLILSKLNLSETYIIAKGKEHDDSITDEKAFKKGMFEVQVDFKEASALMRKYGGIVTVHAGDKSNSINMMKHKGSSVRNVKNIADSLGPLKTELLKEYVDICELDKINDGDVIFYWRNFGRVSILASDAHKVNDIGSDCVWIKADPNFNGLKQAVIEPDRIFMGEIPPALERIRNNKTKTIDSLSVDCIDSYSGDRGEWFKDIHIPLNPEMTVIIGNKGSGKTAIAEIIGLLSNSRNEKDFAFLAPKKFREKKLANNFTATLRWYEDSFEISKNIGANIDENAQELVHCVPQNSFEKYCNENSDQGFIDEVNSVVFSRMSREEKLGFDTFQELQKNKESIIDARKKDIGIIIEDLNEKIKLLEEKRDLSYKESLISTRDNIKRELSEHNKNKPLEEKPPEGLVTDEYTKQVSELKIIEDDIKSAKDALDIATKHRSEVLLIKKSFENLKTSISEKMKDLSSNLSVYNLEADKILKYSLDLSSVNAIYEKYDNEVTMLQSSLKKSDYANSENKTLIDRKIELEALIHKFNASHEGKLTKYQDYLSKSKIWNEKSSALLVEIDKLDRQIEYIGNCIDSQIVVDLSELKADRLEKVKQIFKCLLEKKAIFDNFKEPIVTFLKDYSVTLGEFKAEINTGIYPKDQYAKFIVDTYINNAVTSSFRGADGIKQISEYLSLHDFSSEDDLISFITQMQNALEQTTDNKCYHNAFKKGMYDSFVNDFYKLTFLDARYSLQLFGKELPSLSPGERGSLLLVFYLLLDARDIPLILDQPEDNLDNESVAKILVPFIKEAKKKRQIIIVTHNSNLAVVSDAEQVIRVKIDKLNNRKFTFESGSLESEIINDVVDVLEGTINSFNIRKDKYLN
ncbi:MAG: PHP domain-containing protein [Eubacteriales bacterium]